MSGKGEAMEATEINALLAEKLFGWADLHRDEDGRLWATQGGKRTDFGYREVEEVFGYSTTWEGMGLVAEAMGAKGLQLTLCIGTGWANAKFSTPASELLGCPGWTHRDTAPMAVALAALKALGVEVAS